MSKPFLKLTYLPEGSLGLAVVTVLNTARTAVFSTGGDSTIAIINLMTDPFTVITDQNAVVVPRKLVLDLDTKPSITLAGKTVQLTNELRKVITSGEISLGALGNFSVTKDIKGIEDDLLTSPEFNSYVASLLEGLIPKNTLHSLRYFLKRQEGKKHVLVTGHSGNGKTHAMYQQAKDSGRELVFISLDNGTETMDLTGYSTRLPDGSFGWIQGALSKAFTRASKGVKVMLVLDELLRAQPRELSVLLRALDKQGGRYSIDTGKPLIDLIDEDGNIPTETISVPAENLWCVATTNQGIGYHTSKIDEALKQRFRVYEKHTDLDELTEVILLAIKQKDYGELPNIETSITNIKTNIDALIETGMLKIPMSLRHASEIILDSTDVSDIKTRMLELIPNLVSTTSAGDLNSTQIGLIKGVVETHWKES